jgi:hypothetical protein
MKRVVFYALAVALVAGIGCKRKDDGTTELMSAEEVVNKTQETAIKSTEKTAEVTQQATAAVSSFSVKAEDVMGDLNSSVEELKQKVAGFEKTQVIAYADKYKDVILEKKDQITELSEKVKGLSMTEVIGEKGKALKEELSQYTDQLDGLKDRFGVYLEKLETYGVDLSAYGL